MAKNPGIIITDSKNRKFIVFNKQLLLTSHQKMILNFVDEDHNLIKKEDGVTDRILMKSVEDYAEFMKTCKLIGYVD